MTQTELDQCARLSEFILHKKLSQKELAEALGVSDSYVSQLIQGKRAISMNVVKSLVKAYSIDVDWLINGNSNQAMETGVEYNASLPGVFSTFYNDILKRVKTLEVEQKRISLLLEKHNIA